MKAFTRPFYHKKNGLVYIPKQNLWKKKLDQGKQRPLYNVLYEDVSLALCPRLSLERLPVNFIYYKCTI